MKQFIVFFLIFLSFLALLPKVILADYPTFRNDFKRSGQSIFFITDNLIKDFTSPNIGWIQNPPAIDADGNIYAAIWNGGLIAFNKDGQKLWSSGTYDPNGTPTFDNNGNIYFCAGTSNPYVYSFTKSGQKRWEYSLRPPGSYYSNSCLSSPAMSPSKDTLYITVDWPTQSIMAFNLDGTVKWDRGIGYSPWTSSIAVADDGTLYVGTNGSGAFLSLTPNGIINWTRSAGTVFNTPLIGSDGNIYITNYAWNGTSIISYTPGGQWRWTYPGSSYLAPELAFKDNTVYAASDNKVLAINSTNGSLKWTWQAPIAAITRSSPSVDNNGVIFVSMDNTLYSIDPTGAKKWEWPITANLSIPIIFDNNKILLYSRSSGNIGYFYILGKNPTTKTPVIFIPGIGGSELKSTQTFASGIKECNLVSNFIYHVDEVVWVNKTMMATSLCDDYLDVLKLKADGITPEYPQVTLNNSIYQDSYGDTIQFFKDSGYESDKTLFVFPYDWRKDISETSPLLDQLVETIKQKSGSQKVDIVAHSMGGLVAKNYIKDPTQAGKVRKLITLGTPYLGSVKLLKALRYGDYFGPTFLLGLIGINPAETKDIVQNFTGAFELLPSKAYYEFYNNSDPEHSIPFRDDSDVDKNNVTGPLNFDQTKQMLSNFGHNMNLFNVADNFHDQLDKIWQTSTNNVDTILITGSGKPTLMQIHEQNKIKIHFETESGLQINKREEIFANGDDTVPLFSASLTDGTQTIAGLSKIFYVNQTHGNLVNRNSGPALQLVKNILANNTDIPAKVQTSPYKLDGKTIIIQSPVELNIYDTSGNHTGPTTNGDFENNIPGSFYDTLESTKMIWLPEDGQYNIKLNATDNGTFDLKIRSFDNDINNQTIIYKDIPISTATKAELNYDTTSPAPPSLNIDTDGNGTVDKVVEADAVLEGNQVYDQQAPTTTIQLNGNQGNNGWYKSDVTVTLTATDEVNGSGILKTEYSLDDGKTINKYSAPFTVSQEGITKIQVKSTDKAGNEEFPLKTTEIKIDKTAPVVNLSVDPEELWPVNKEMIDVLVSGSTTDNISGIASKTFMVTDKYQKLNPTISDFNQTIKLEAYRDGNDMDGRIYTIKVIAEDLAGNQQTAITQVIVPHDQGKK